jgi:hypothetical protein
MCVRVQFLSSGKRGVRLGLIVEGEQGHLGLELMMICLRLHTLFSIGVSS